MKKGLYVIRDNVAGAAAGPVMTFAHDAVAVREFRDIALNEKSSLHAHLEDYDLVCVGEFDAEQCIVGHEQAAAGGAVPNRVVLSGAALKASRERQDEPQLGLES